MVDKRKADMFAGEGSLAGRLRKRRQAIEEGDPSGGQSFVDKRDWKNSARRQVDRGYRVETDDE